MASKQHGRENLLSMTRLENLPLETISEENFEPDQESAFWKDALYADQTKVKIVSNIASEPESLSILASRVNQSRLKAILIQKDTIPPPEENQIDLKLPTIGEIHISPEYSTLATQGIHMFTYCREWLRYADIGFIDSNSYSYINTESRTWSSAKPKMNSIKEDNILVLGVKDLSKKIGEDSAAENRETFTKGYELSYTLIETQKFLDHEKRESLNIRFDKLDVLNLNIGVSICP